MISAQDQARYRENGYLLVEDLVDRDSLAAIDAELAELIAESAGVRESNTIYDLEDTHSETSPRVRRIKTPHLWMPSVAKLSRHPAMVETLTQLLGPGVRLQTSKLNMKSAGYGAPVEWHQDWAFYPHTNDDLLAVGVFLDDMNMVNGPLQVLPGSHRGPIYDHHVDGYFSGSIDPAADGLDFSNAHALTGPAGSMSFHHVRVVHGSALNRSDRPRRLLLFQFTAVDAWPLIEQVADIADYDAQIVAGEPTLVPRVESVPVRLPLPPAPNQGSIYENQRARKTKYFEQFEAF